MPDHFKPTVASDANGRSRGGRAKAAVTFAAQLKVDSVSRSYGTAFALKDVSLEVAPSKILCLLGPSGCGKTTLLRIIAGVEAPSSGAIWLDDEEVAGPHHFVPPEKRGVGLMFQDYALFPHLTILDNVAFGLHALGKQEARAEARTALKRVGLARYEGEYPHILSGGQQQRVALARAIAPRPGVILMDEPFSGLDAQLRENMREETLSIVRESRATCIVVTHDPEEAMRMGDGIALMREGRVVQIGAPPELYRAPTDIFAARTFSDLNEFEARVQGGQARTALGTFGAPSFQDGTGVIVCLRQGGIRLLEPGQGTPGRVLDTRFLGDVGLLEIAINELETPILARVRDADMPQRGAEVGVGVDEGAVLIFASHDDRP